MGKIHDVFLEPQGRVLSQKYKLSPPGLHTPSTSGYESHLHIRITREDSEDTDA